MNAFIGTDIGGYGFAPGTNQVSFFGVSITDLDQIVLITNVTTGAILFNFADPALGGTLNQNTVTLEKDCTGMNASDHLQVICRVPDTVLNEANPTKVEIVKSFNETSHPDSDMWGTQGPVTQVDRGQSNYDEIHPQLSYDTNLENVFGSQRVVGPDQKVNVRTVPEDGFFSFRLYGVSEQIIKLPDGANTVTVLMSPITGTANIVAAVSLDGVNWTNSYMDNPSTMTGTPTLGTISVGSAVPYVINVTGASLFRLANSNPSTSASFFIRSSQQVKLPIRADWLRGGATNALAQRNSGVYNGLDLQVVDSGLIKDAFIDPVWHPRGTYIIGDVVSWNGQNWICRASYDQTVNPLIYPGGPGTSGSWILDPRQNKSLITSQYVSPPAAARMRIEIDMDAQQMRWAESQDFQSKLLVQQGLERGVDYVNVGQAFGGGMTSYLIEEIR